MRKAELDQQSYVLRDNAAESFLLSDDVSKDAEGRVGSAIICTGSPRSGEFPSLRRRLEGCGRPSWISNHMYWEPTQRRVSFSQTTSRRMRKAELDQQSYVLGAHAAESFRLSDDVSKDAEVRVESAIICTGRPRSGEFPSLRRRLEGCGRPSWISNHMYWETTQRRVSFSQTTSRRMQKAELDQQSYVLGAHAAESFRLSDDVSKDAEGRVGSAIICTGSPRSGEFPSLRRRLEGCGRPSWISNHMYWETTQRRVSFSQTTSRRMRKAELDQQSYVLGDHAAGEFPSLRRRLEGCGRPSWISNHMYWEPTQRRVSFSQTTSRRMRKAELDQQSYVLGAHAAESFRLSDDVSKGCGRSSWISNHMYWEPRQRRVSVSQTTSRRMRKAELDQQSYVLGAHAAESFRLSDDVSKDAEGRVGSAIICTGSPRSGEFPSLRRRLEGCGRPSWISNHMYWEPTQRRVSVSQTTSRRMRKAELDQQSYVLGAQAAESFLLSDDVSKDAEGRVGSAIICTGSPGSGEFPSLRRRLEGCGRPSWISNHMYWEPTQRRVSFSQTTSRKMRKVELDQQSYVLGAQAAESFRLSDYVSKDAEGRVGSAIICTGSPRSGEFPSLRRRLEGCGRSSWISNHMYWEPRQRRVSFSQTTSRRMRKVELDQQSYVLGAHAAQSFHLSDDVSKDAEGRVESAIICTGSPRSGEFPSLRRRLEGCGRPSWISNHMYWEPTQRRVSFSQTTSRRMRKAELDQQSYVLGAHAAESFRPSDEVSKDAEGRVGSAIICTGSPRSGEFPSLRRRLEGCGRPSWISNHMYWEPTQRRVSVSQTTSRRMRKAELDQQSYVLGAHAAESFRLSDDVSKDAEGRVGSAIICTGSPRSGEFPSLRRRLEGCGRPSWISNHMYWEPTQRRVSFSQTTSRRMRKAELDQQSYVLGAHAAESFRLSDDVSKDAEGRVGSAIICTGAHAAESFLLSDDVSKDAEGRVGSAIICTGSPRSGEFPSLRRRLEGCGGPSWISNHMYWEPTQRKFPSLRRRLEGCGRPSWISNHMYWEPRQRRVSVSQTTSRRMRKKADTRLEGCGRPSCKEGRVMRKAELDQQSYVLGAHAAESFLLSDDVSKDAEGPSWISNHMYWEPTQRRVSFSQTTSRRMRKAELDQQSVHMIADPTRPSASFETSSERRKLSAAWSPSTYDC